MSYIVVLQGWGGISSGDNLLRANLGLALFFLVSDEFKFCAYQMQNCAKKFGADNFDTKLKTAFPTNLSLAWYDKFHSSPCRGVGVHRRCAASCGPRSGGPLGVEFRKSGEPPFRDVRDGAGDHLLFQCETPRAALVLSTEIRSATRPSADDALE